MGKLAQGGYHNAYICRKVKPDTVEVKAPKFDPENYPKFYLCVDFKMVSLISD